MAEFILEEQIEKVINKNTKEYLKEVISSYNNGNYRAAVVALYTTVIYDLLHKIVILKEIYKDEGAKGILNDIQKQQKNDPKSPRWEENLIKEVFEKTKLITAVEKEELIHLKNERNYAAHPIVNLEEGNDELHLKQITKETAKDLIRKAFEIVFLRDAILAKDIVKNIILDINEYYNRVKTDGLEMFLKDKYFRRMTQERKDGLFKALWKLVFILNNDDCNKGRQANYWGLVYLYHEDKNHYQELMKKDESYYFDKLELETIKDWNFDGDTEIGFYALYLFKKRSRMINLVNFLKQAPEVYKILNDYAKNIVKQSIDYMYLDEKLIKTPIYQAVNCNADLFKEQVRLKADAVFLTENILEHFKMIFDMIRNYQNTSKNFCNVDRYLVLDESDLEDIFHQSEYRGYEKEFLKFLIEYCTGAQQFWQVPQLFSYLKMFKDYFREEHYYIILAEINENSQYYVNREKGKMLQELEQMFAERYKCELIGENMERYLYSHLYCFEKGAEKCRAVDVFQLIDKRAMYYSAGSLSRLIEFIYMLVGNLDDLKQQQPSSYPNIVSVLANKSDPSYREYHIKEFDRYFNDH